ncbi:MFS transporter [Calidifontibacillus erzurumensis]|uniref:MFS transporter n=1 Tax=Calidifontibacillus erzurumensis TaxID=2741433 RepID=A0A8J8GFB2_9BACI|nr:MFS transporter [Calidifontibacillus erzurumensis]NSL52834.1 MFS transporter [Calidifontibacillus erzurumensis]
MEHYNSKLWTKDFIIVSTINFFLALVFYLLVVTIAVYAVDKYDASTSEAGLITGIFIIGTLIGRLFIGRLINIIGQRKTLFIGLIMYLVTTSFYFINAGIAFLLLTRFLHGIALGVANTATGTIVAQTIPANRKGEGIGYFSMSATLAAALGPFIGLYMSQHTTFQMIFSFCLALGLISLLIGLFLHVPAIPAREEEAKQKLFVFKKPKLSNFVEPRALPIATITLVTSLCYASVLSFVNFYAIEKDLVTAASFFFVVYAGAVLLSRPITGRLMDVKGANVVMYPAFFILAAGMILLSLADNGFTFLISGILIGLGFGNIQSCTQAIAVKLTPVQRMGLATSTFFIFLDAGLGFGPYLLGFLIPLTGYSFLYGILGIVAMLSSILYYFLHGKKDKMDRKKESSTLAAL